MARTLDQLMPLARLGRVRRGRAASVHRARDRRYIKQLETSAAIALRLRGLLDLREFAREFHRLVRLRFGYTDVHLLVWSAADGCLRQPAVDSASADRAVIPLAEAGLLRDVLASGAPVLVEDEPTGSRTRAIVPIYFGGQVVGLLDLHGHGRRHRRIELVGLQRLADEVGVALHNCDLYGEALSARKQAENSERLKTRLLANVSHELRAPLNVILGYSQAALAVPNSYGLELPAGLLRDLQHIYTSGDHLRRLINDLLDLSRAEVDALELFLELLEPGAVLEEIFCAASSPLDPLPGVTWRLELAPDLPLIRADPVRLRQVLDNLLNNARASTAEGEIVLGAGVDSEQLHVWVRDTGEGIPADQHERIFEPFVSERRRARGRTGIGLGLAITRRLVTLHGGTIAVESVPGQGSTFHVRLPLLAPTDGPTGCLGSRTKPVPSDAVLRAIDALQPAGRTGTVLIVDDDPEARAFYSSLVSEALPRCAIETADHGAAALRLLACRRDPPVLVILDLAMPELDGFGVLEHLRADHRTRQVPVLVVSGRLLSDDEVRRLDQHARVLYQTKHLLSPVEAQVVLQSAADGHALLPQPTSAAVKKAMALLNENHRRPLARHDLAYALGVSDNYLSQIFHRELGLSPRDYLSRVRIHRAKALLTSTDESITAIDIQVGFEDPAYFSRVFHKLVGQSPQTYRQRS
jgi:signal transduction histidine kinase/AraC-like DNA-binding protein